MQLPRKITNPVRRSTLLGSLLALTVLLAVAATPAAARQPLGSGTGAHHGKTKRHASHRIERLGRAVQLGHNSRVTPAPPILGDTLLEAGFEGGLANWNTAGVGEVMPTVTSSVARTGSESGRVALTGSQNRSELILGGNGDGSTSGQIEFDEGAEYWYGFSFDIQQMVYGHPGAHNLIMQFKSDGEGSPNFGLQLWDVNGKKGLWTGGPSQEIGGGGERFLAPLSEHAWHDVQIHFKASSVGAGFYEVFLDDNLIDAQGGVSMIVPGHSYGYIKDGIYRNGDIIPGTSEIHLDAAKLGETRESVLP